MQLFKIGKSFLFRYKLAQPYCPLSSACWHLCLPLNFAIETNRSGDNRIPAIQLNYKRNLFAAGWWLNGEWHGSFWIAHNAKQILIRFGICAKLCLKVLQDFLASVVAHHSVCWMDNPIYDGGGMDQHFDSPSSSSTDIEQLVGDEFFANNVEQSKLQRYKKVWGDVFFESGLVSQVCLSIHFSYPACSNLSVGKCE